jgi:hypothetical protein
MTKLEELKAAYEAARNAAYGTTINARGFVAYATVDELPLDDADAAAIHDAVWNAKDDAWDAYWAELKKIQKEIRDD